MEQPPTTDQFVDAIMAGLRRYAAEQFPDVWEELTEFGRQEFVGELVDAFVGAAPEDRNMAMGEVVEAWVRTWLIRQAPGYPEARERAERTAASEDLGEKTYTLDELRARIGLSPTA